MPSLNPSPSPGFRNHRLARVLAAGALGLAVAFMLWRGVWPAATGSGDLTTGYSAGRAWIAGGDPYDLAVLQDELSRAGGGAESAGLDEIRNVYVPTTLPLFAPLAVFDWPAARLVALGINIAALLVIVLGLVRFLGLTPLAASALGIAALFVALAPLRTTLASGQTGLIAVALLVGAALLERSGHRLVAGVAYGLATVAKVQIGLPFLVYVAWRRRWGTAAVAGSVVALFTVVSVARMTFAGIPWWTSWTANLALLTRPGGLDDPGQLNPERYSLVNLQFLLETLGAGGTVGLVIDAILIGVAGLAVIWLIRDRNPPRELLALSIIAVLTLLVTYHRYYDAVLLAFPIAWAFWRVSTRQRWKGVIVLVLCADFILPVPTNLRNLQVGGSLPDWLTQNPLWEPLVLAQNVWALVLIGVTLLWAAAADDEYIGAGAAGTVVPDLSQADPAT